MRIFILGNDNGNAVLISLLLILTLSLLFLSFVPRIIALNRYAKEYKVEVIEKIKIYNKEVITHYDFN